MEKNTRTALFLAGATVFNILLILVVVMIPLGIFMLFFQQKMPGVAAAITLIVLLVGTLLLSFTLYGVILKAVIKRFHLEDSLGHLMRKKK